MCIWNVKKMADYAIEQYNLATGFNEDGNCYRERYERTIRRNLRKSNLVKEDKKTGKYIYELPEENAKYFIDNNLKKYFNNEKKYDDQVAKEKFLKLDREINKNYFENLRNQSYENDYEYDDCSTDTTPNNKEIHDAILFAMVKAIFELHYEFDYDTFVKDYIEFCELSHSNDSLEAVQEGYSYLEDKLNNSTKHYCRRKL